MDSVDPRTSANYETATSGVKLGARICLAYEAITTPHYDWLKPLVEMAREHKAKGWREYWGNDTQSYTGTQSGQPFWKEEERRNEDRRLVEE